MRILVLGGYGHFGGRICRSLAADPDTEVLVAGRDAGKAAAFIAASGAHAASMAPLALDAGDARLREHFVDSGAALVVHAAGPFQGCDYDLARAALAAGLHYVDLADARDFVSGFDALDPLARAARCSAVSGASSVPGLSAAVVAAHADRFARLDVVESAISPGNRTPRGLATTRAILGYVGKPWPALVDGAWRQVHGWQSLRRERFAGVGSRWVARCEVPDVALLPRRHPTLRTCDFRAGLELRRMHFGLWLASWAVRAGIVRDLPRWAGPLLRTSERWLALGSDTGVMSVAMHGLDHAGAPLRLRWELRLPGGHGPQVPCTAAIVLARKLARGEVPIGARPCLDLFTLDDYLDALQGFAVETSLFETP